MHTFMHDTKQVNNKYLANPRTVETVLHDMLILVE